ncbi:IS110 family transposase [Echinicola jeungdonensis]|uniref:IS110 family transposase n=1 Tax=Echinicola jeungdonensis TaxID=709343 RepID=A0ABV5J3I3_9BACT
MITVQLLTEIGDIKKLRNFRQFNSYIGLKPVVHSRGDYDRKGYMTYRWRRELKSSLIECTWTTIQRSPIMLK